MRSTHDVLPIEKKKLSQLFTEDPLKYNNYNKEIHFMWMQK